MIYNYIFLNPISIEFIYNLYTITLSVWGGEGQISQYLTWIPYSGGSNPSGGGYPNPDY